MWLNMYVHVHDDGSNGESCSRKVLWCDGKYCSSFHLIPHLRPTLTCNSIFRSARCCHMHCRLLVFVVEISCVPFDERVLPGHVLLSEKKQRMYTRHTSFHVPSPPPPPVSIPPPRGGTVTWR